MARQAHSEVLCIHPQTHLQGQLLIHPQTHSAHVRCETKTQGSRESREASLSSPWPTALTKGLLGSRCMSGPTQAPSDPSWLPA